MDGVRIVIDIMGYIERIFFCHFPVGIDSKGIKLIDF